MADRLDWLIISILDIDNTFGEGHMYTGISLRPTDLAGCMSVTDDKHTDGETTLR